MCASAILSLGLVANSGYAELHVCVRACARTCGEYVYQSGGAAGFGRVRDWEDEVSRLGVKTADECRCFACSFYAFSAPDGETPQRGTGSPANAMVKFCACAEQQDGGYRRELERRPTREPRETSHYLLTALLRTGVLRFLARGVMGAVYEAFRLTYSRQSKPRGRFRH